MTQSPKSFMTSRKPIPPPLSAFGFTIGTACRLSKGLLLHAMPLRRNRCQIQPAKRKKALPKQCFSWWRLGDSNPSLTPHNPCIFKGLQFCVHFRVQIHFTQMICTVKIRVGDSEPYTRSRLTSTCASSPRVTLDFGRVPSMAPAALAFCIARSSQVAAWAAFSASYLAMYSLN